MRDLKRWIDALDTAAKFFERRDDMHLVATLEEIAEFLVALTETGPDYRAAKQAYEDAPVPIRSEDFVRRIVDAALADYLTEEP